MSNMNSPITIRLERNSTNQQWGFRLQGGSDFPIPLSIQLVNANTLAHINGLNAGDHIVSINGRNATKLTHQEAKMEITRSGNELELTVMKEANNQQSVPSCQSFSQTKISSVQQMPVVQSNFTVPKQSQFYLGSNSQNRTGMPIDKRVRNEMIHQEGKSSYYKYETPEYLHPKVSNFESSPAYNRNPLQREVWRSKAYHDNPQASVDHFGTVVFHAQYNSPIALYSDDKVLEAFKSQTGNLIDDIKGNSPSIMTINNLDRDYNQSSPTYQAVMNYEQQKHIPHSLEGKLSRSFRALEEDLLSVEGTTRTPKSIFDQRRRQ